MNRALYIVLIFAVTTIQACGNSVSGKQLRAVKGKVVLVKSKYLEDSKVHYGAFTIVDIVPPVKTMQNSIVSYITYQWYMDNPINNNQGINTINDTTPIKFGNGVPGIGLSWDYANKNSVYLSLHTFGAEFGTHFCITEFKILPNMPLSEISCNYHVPKEHESK